MSPFASEGLPCCGITVPCACSHKERVVRLIVGGKYTEALTEQQREELIADATRLGYFDRAEIGQTDLDVAGAWLRVLEWVGHR